MKITENFTYIGTQQNFERDSDSSEKKVNKGGKK